MSLDIFNKIVDDYDNENQNAMENLDTTSAEYIEEKKVFDAMLKGIQANEEFAIIDEINRIHESKSSTHSLSWWMARAAAVVLIVGAGAFFYLNNTGATMNDQSNEFNVDESPSYADSATYMEDTIINVKDSMIK